MKSNRFVRPYPFNPPKHSGQVDPRWRWLWEQGNFLSLPAHGIGGPGSRIPTYGNTHMTFAEAETNSEVFTSQGPYGLSLDGTENASATYIGVALPNSIDSDMFSLAKDNRWFMMCMFSIVDAVADDRVIGFNREGVIDQFICRVEPFTEPYDLVCYLGQSDQLRFDGSIYDGVTYVLLFWCGGNEDNFAVLLNVDTGEVVGGYDAFTDSDSVSYPDELRIMAKGNGDEFRGNYYVAHLWEERENIWSPSGIGAQPLTMWWKDMIELCYDPWGPLRRAPGVVGFAPVTEYEINAELGSYALAGVDATLIKDMQLNAESSSYSLTGSDITELRALMFDAAADAYAVTGADASITSAHVLNAEPASYSITGVAASLIADRVIVALSASYTLTGADTSYLRTLVLDAVAGSYGLTGLDVNLLTIGSYEINAEPGAYTLAGQIGTLLAAHQINAAAGLYTATGAAASTLADHILNAESASYVLTGAAATAAANRVVAALEGSYGVTGAPAEQMRTLMFNAETSSYTLTGYDISTSIGGVILLPSVGNTILVDKKTDLIELKPIRTITIGQ